VAEILGLETLHHALPIVLQTRETDAQTTSSGKSRRGRGRVYTCEQTHLPLIEACVPALASQKFVGVPLTEALLVLLLQVPKRAQQHSNAAGVKSDCRVRGSTQNQESAFARGD